MLVSERSNNSDYYSVCTSAMINCFGKQSLLQAMIFCQKKLLHQSARSFLHASSIFIQCNRLWSIFIILNINNLEFTTIGVCLAPREPFGIKVKKTERTVYLEIERGSNSITRPHKRTPKTLDHPYLGTMVNNYYYYGLIPSLWL